ncbi:DnaJ-like protein [Chloropicon primus]|nr:DnaJ-like protein [Chloropicon primus]
MGKDATEATGGEMTARGAATSGPGDPPNTTTSRGGGGGGVGLDKDRDSGKGAEALLREFMLDVSDARRTAECDRVLGCFKLNPYEILSLWKQDLATSSEIRRQFRQVSLLVHPDKCKHKDAKAAFELVQKAYKDLCDEEAKREADATIRHARLELRKERRKLTSKDNAYLAAAALRTATTAAAAGKAKEGEGAAPGGDNEAKEGAEKPGAEAGEGEGRTVPVGVAQLEAEYEASEGFQKQLRLKAQELMTQLEWRRRQLGKRLKGEKERVDKEAENFKAEMKKKAKEKNTWEKGREKRASNWRDFMQKKKKKRKV